MILKNCDYETLSRNVIKYKKRIIIYGAGMIGQTIVPSILIDYGLLPCVDCFVDKDVRKQGQYIDIGLKKLRINPIEHLYKKHENIVILITNSNFLPIVQFLDGIDKLEEVEAYIIPLMQNSVWEQRESISIKHLTLTPCIPKKIHYCWFGKKEMTDFLQDCINSWKKHCPNYEIVLWNEDNYDVERHIYTKEAYSAGKYSFVSDFARLDILYENGGFYFDTDVMLCKNLDDLLYQEAFVGTEKWGNINTGGGCGFIAGHPILKELIDYKDGTNFFKNDGTMDESTNGVLETLTFVKNGYKPDGTLQKISGVVVYPPYVTHPYDYMSCKMQMRDATVSIHYFCGSWMDEKDVNSRKETQEKYSKIVERIQGHDK